VNDVSVTISIPTTWTTNTVVYEVEQFILSADGKQLFAVVVWAKGYTRIVDTPRIALPRRYPHLKHPEVRAAAAAAAACAAAQVSRRPGHDVNTARRNALDRNQPNSEGGNPSAAYGIAGKFVAAWNL
jgi:hypothetical protein